METEEITIRVSSEIARAYREATQEEKRKMNLLCELDLRSSIKREHARSLKAMMAEIGRKAQERGMTPEILEEILGKPIRHIL